MYSFIHSFITIIMVVVIIISSSIIFDDERNAFLINGFLGV